jgi:hypothetical protein
MEYIKCNQVLSSFIACNEMQRSSVNKQQRSLGTIEYRAKDGNVFYATVRKQGIVATQGNWQYVYKNISHWLKMQFNINLHNPLLTQ